MVKNIVLLLLLLTTLKITAQQTNCKDFLDIAAIEQKAYASRINTNQTSQASDNFSIYYSRFVWKVNPAIRFIEGIATIYFTSLTTNNNIVLDLSNQLIVDSILFRHQSINFQQQSNNALAILFNTTINTLQKDSVTIYYKGVPSTSGFNSFVQTTHNNIPVIWTLSEPYGSQDWFPCRNGLDNKIDSIDIFIIHPSMYKATANGVLQYEQTNAGQTTTFFKHRYPIASYLIAFSVTNFSVINENIQLGNISMPFKSYVYPESVANFQTATETTKNAMQLFHETFGDYPFIQEQYGHTQFGWGGGMEHQTNSFITAPDKNLIAHELAHQWFGDKITCGSWQDIWLNEGFATFCANYYFENFDTTTFKSILTAHLNDIVSIADGSVFAKDTSSIGTIFNGRLSYNKAAYVLRMLRFTIGDSAFFTAIKQYLNDPNLQYGFAKTADFIHHVEAVTKQDMSWFFNQWIYGEGYPSFQVTWSENNDNWAKIKINQTTSHSSVPFFKILLPLTFKNATQQKTILVQCNSNGAETWADIGFAADTVLIDVGKQLISKNNTTIKTTPIDATIDDVLIYPNPVSNYLNIGFKTPVARKIQIQLYNALGQLLFTKEFVINSISESLKIPFANYSKGLYIIQLKTDKDWKMVKKIIK
ncbi:MAG: T9SS type A sorting domain-containing protein [Chitinophagaceae bacterium]|nr:T9SS type A sorting domain-containing protein [Chitinophagaceae bacterium]MCW5906102.1 T9SS type A sorting domain-containing protein [Chitinophagaceae bacterium]